MNSNKKKKDDLELQNFWDFVTPSVTKVEKEKTVNSVSQNDEKLALNRQNWVQRGLQGLRYLSFKIGICLWKVFQPVWETFCKPFWLTLIQPFWVNFLLPYIFYPAILTLGEILKRVIRACVTIITYVFGFVLIIKLAFAEIQKQSFFIQLRNFLEKLQQMKTFFTEVFSSFLIALETAWADVSDSLNLPFFKIEQIKPLVQNVPKKAIYATVWDFLRDPPVLTTLSLVVLGLLCLLILGNLIENGRERKN